MKLSESSDVTGKNKNLEGKQEDDSSDKDEETSDFMELLIKEKLFD